jgi:hypothetical protein
MVDSVRGMGGLTEGRVPKQRYGWLSRGTGAKVEIWVAKQRDGWQRDGWLCKLAY